jgi:pimeloyl-ACP methyl ester carboxylesterase
MPGQRVYDWPFAVEELVDDLGISEFAVFGGSGGSAYALSCAARLPGRVTRVGLMSPAGPYFEHPELAAEAEHFAQLISRAKADVEAAWRAHLASTSIATERILADPEADLAARLSRLSSAERAVTERFARDRADTDRDMLRQGALGWAWDLFSVVASPWGFDVREVQTPTHIWSGDRDRVTAPAAQWLAGQLPIATLHEIPGGYHALDLAAEDILATIVGHSRLTRDDPAPPLASDTNTSRSEPS